MFLHDLIDPALLDDMIEQGYIRRQIHPELPLAILNYSEKAQFEHKWNAATRNCRGLIYQTGDGNRQIIARPFPKFFNYGQEDVHFSQYHVPVNVTDKLDGSLGILYPTVRTKDGMGYAIATRGSFTSVQALHGTARLQEYLAAGYRPYQSYTDLFEIIYPGNRIVVDYQDVDDLYWIGSVNITDGWSTGPFGEDYWPGPRTTVFTARTFQEAIEMPPRKNAEGIVVHFIDLDKRLKIKQDDYVALHRIVTGLNARAVWSQLAEGRLVKDICAVLPDDFHEWVQQVAKGLRAQYDKIWDTVTAEFVNVLDKFEGREFTRKDFAMIAKKSDNARYLFLLFDGKPIGQLVWQEIRPEAEKGPWQRGEDNA